MSGPVRGAVLVAAALDAALAEPPAAWHPVVWAGRYLHRTGARLPATPPTRAVVHGAAAWAVGAAAAVATGWLTDRVARRLPEPAGAVVTGVALWPLLSGRMLLAEVAGVGTALDTGDDAGRAAVGRIVSRPTGTLTAEQVRAAAIESLAENLSDALVATLVWYSLAGLPGAALHRFANTADAMWGYRDPRWLHAGRVAARADDLVNLLPARLTAALLAPPGTWRRLSREAGHTSSPNAGWPMAAMALRLDVRLTKEESYVLHPDGRAPGPEDLRAALAAARHAAVAAVLAALLLDLLIDLRPHPSRGAR